MRRFVLLCEELEARPEDGDRVAALARWFAEVGREASLAAANWLLPAEPGRRPSRPPRIPLHRLRWAAREVAVQAGVPGWLFDAGAEACRDPAEAIALNLPVPPAGASAPAASRPTLASWLQGWREAATVEDADDRVRAIARTIARLEDGPSRRWAVRAVCSLARPVVDPWQWMRAWARAFEDDLSVLAWSWYTHGRISALRGPAEFPGMLPRPAPFVRHLRREDDERAPVPEADERSGEPSWRGPRVQVVRADDAIALWQHDGELLNARVESLLLSQAWPESTAIEGVLIGWHAGRVVSPWSATRGVVTRGRARAGDVEAPTLHLVLTDWHRWEGRDAADWPLATRRQRLRERWPEFDARWIDTVPPPVFVTPEIASLAPAETTRIASGVLLRPAGPRGDPQAQPVWHRPGPRHRLRVVLQYVPSEAVGPNGLPALAALPSGFAVWSRGPRSASERTAGMMHSLSPLTEPDPDPLGGPGEACGAARLLPLVRLPLALERARLARLHAWIREHAGPRFGTMNTVLPALVFEISFESAHESRRHRAGIALEEARLEDWLEDAPAGAADDLARVGAGPCSA